MIQPIATNLYVEVRENAVNLPIPSAPHRRVQALQYVLQNRGIQRITVRVDFSVSRHIELVFPRKRTVVDDRDDEGDNASPLILHTVIEPFERRHVVHVVRVGGARAFVRVEYSIADAEDIQRDENAKETCNAILHQAIAQSQATYKSGRHEIVSAVSADTLDATMTRRLCRDINRFSRHHAVDFIDPDFVPSTATLWGAPETPVWMRPSFGAQCGTWRHLGDVVNSSWSFITDTGTSGTNSISSMETSWIYEGLPGQESWVCAIASLHSNAPLWCGQWWFGERQCKRLNRSHTQIKDTSVVAVRLCDENGKQWRNVLVDLFVPVAANGGLLCAWPHTGDGYAVLVQKAYAKLCGSYAAIALRPTRTILEELTGLPTVELFPNGAWHASGGLHNSTATLGRDKRLELSSKKTQHERVVMVTFQAIDQHHCAFQLLGVKASQSTSSSPCLPLSSSSVLPFVIRDPIRVLHKAAASQLGADVASVTEDDVCFLSEAVFLELQPIVFELLVSHSHAWRRRKLCLQRDGTGVVSFQFAVSCASLQTIVVRGFATKLRDSGSAKTPTPTSRARATGMTVDRVEDDGTWTRLVANKGESASCQLQWTASAGEYVVTLVVIPKSAADAEVHDDTRTLETQGVQANVRLLFQMLDHNMDGYLDKSELLDFFRLHEQNAIVDTDEISNAVDCFLHTHALNSASGLGLSVDDLMGVYQSLVVQADPTAPGTLGEVDDDDLAALVVRDLHQLLGMGNDTAIRTGDLWGLSCVVSSDRDDIILANLG